MFYLCNILLKMTTYSYSLKNKPLRMANVFFFFFNKILFELAGDPQAAD